MKILKDSFIYLIGELLNKVLPFLLLPYLTRKLGAEGFGELSYYLTILALLSVFIGLSQEGAVTRYFYFYGNKALDLIVRTGYIYNIIFSIVCFLIALILKSEVIAYITLIAMFNSFLSVQLALRQAQKQPIPYILIQFLSSISMVALTVIMLEFFAGNQVVNRLLALLFSSSLVFFVTYLFINRRFKINRRFSISNYKTAIVYIFSFGVPLILHQLSFFMKGQVDRIFIYKLYTPAELGVYSAGVQIASVLTIFFMAINKAILPYYYEALKNKKLDLKGIKRYALLSFLFLPIPALICFLLPSQFFIWFLGKQFSESQYFSSLFFLGYGLNLPYLILVNYLFYYAENFLIAKITFYSSIIYIILLSLLSQISIQIIPFSLIISNIFMVFFLWLIISKKKVVC